MNITIVQTFTDGFTTYQSGQELSVPSEVAQRWIADGKAQADTDGQQSWLSSTEVAATRALVSKEGNYALGALAIDLLPNNTLTDTVITQQQLAVATIPGGVFGPRSIIEVEALCVATGVNSKTFGFKAGQASGNMASAVAFGGTGGVVAQGNIGTKALLWGNGSLGAQRATPNGPINWAAAHASSIIMLGIDTSLDWNIYLYVQFSVASAGDTFMVRPFWATWKR